MLNATESKVIVDIPDVTDVGVGTSVDIDGCETGGLIGCGADIGFTDSGTTVGIDGFRIFFGRNLLNKPFNGSFNERNFCFNSVNVFSFFFLLVELL